MKRLTISAAIISTAALLSGAARAMEIRQFDKMADQDKSEFVAELVTGAQKVLRDEGRSDFADKVHTLFTTVNPGSEIPLGVGEFEKNLARARVADAQRAANDPTARRLEVEDAMAVTLQKNGIEVPDSFFTVARTFHPKLPSQQ